MDYTLEQLKAMAYDELVKLEISQANLRQINLAIAEKQKDKKAEVVESE
jgi:hypothetical protein